MSIYNICDTNRYILFNLVCVPVLLLTCTSLVSKYEINFSGREPHQVSSAHALDVKGVEFIQSVN